MDKRYYSLVKDNKEATLTIFGDITSWEWLESDVSSYNLSKELEELDDVETIHVRINSYGGEVAEGLAIYNALRNHSAKVITYCYGFACSIASVIFMAGDERLMSEASLLMIHNAWTYASGNASELRKQADDLDKITQASINAYMKNVNISEDELKKLMDNETWINSGEAIEKGFATGAYDDSGEKTEASQKVRRSVFNMMYKGELTEPVEPKPEDDPEVDDMEQYECGKCGYIHDGELPEYFVCPECGAGKEEFTKVGDDLEEEVTYTCSECGYVHDGELPEYFVCPECGAGKGAFSKDGTEDANQKAITYFSKLLGGIRND